MLARIKIVIARSVSDEAIQHLLQLLDCFAEFIIGPTTSGRTRWLAMTIRPVQSKILCCKRRDKTARA
jgi:hypothetical protein